MEIFKGIKKMIIPACFAIGLAATACSGQPPTDIPPVVPIIDTAKTPLPPVLTRTSVPASRLAMPTPDARWRSNATDAELRGVVESQLRIYNQIFKRSLLIKNVSVLPTIDLAALQWDHDTLTIFRPGIGYGVDQAQPDQVIHELAHADVKPPQETDPDKLKKGASILYALKGVDTRNVQIALAVGFRFKLFSPAINAENKPDVLEIAINNPTEEATAQAITIIADQKQGLFYDTTTNYYGNAASFLLWVNKNKAVKGSITDDAFVSFHQQSDIFSYYEQITGAKDDVFFMVSLDHILSKIMSNERLNKSQGAEREKMYGKYYEELMNLYRGFKQSSLKQNYDAVDVWAMLYGLPWSIDESLCNKAVKQVMCQGVPPSEAARKAHAKVESKLKKQVV